MQQVAERGGRYFDATQIDAVLAREHRVKAIRLTRIVQIRKPDESNLVGKVQIG
jgi:hypothetical protein